MKNPIRRLAALLAVTLCASVAGYVTWPLLFSGETDVPAEATSTDDSDDSDAVPDPPLREADDLLSLWAVTQSQRQAEDWTGLGHTLERICQIDPHNVAAWRFIAWNLAVNVAEERKKVDARYQCVRQAIEALLLGVAKNSKNPQIYWETGQFLAMMFGKAPDSAHFRTAFASDLPLHELLTKHVNMDAANGPTGRPDNLLVARLWYMKSEKIAEQHGIPPDWRIEDVVRIAAAAKCLLKYAVATQAEGCSEELAVRNWRRAEREWRQFGRREIKTSRGRTARVSDDKLLSDLAVFEEWLQRCQLEQTPEILTARTHLYRAQQASEKKQAQRLYEVAWLSWAVAVKRHDLLLDDRFLFLELDSAIDHYRDTILQDAPLPAGFPLTDVVERSKESDEEFEATLKRLYPDLIPD